MAKPSPRKSGRKARILLLKNGVAAVVLGIGMLTASAVLGGSSPMTAAVSTALSMPAWWAIGIGVSLLLAHWAGLGGRRRQPAPEAKGITRPDPETIRALIDQAERAFAFSQIDPDSEAPPSVGTDAGEAKRQPPGSRWGPAVFAVIEWGRFEAVCESLFVHAGFETRSRPLGAHGGRDIRLYTKRAEAPVAVVRCTHGHGTPIDIDDLRDFAGLMASEHFERGSYITTAAYTAEAKAFANAQGLNVLSVTGLLTLIKQRTPEQQTALLAVAFEGEYWRPTCAGCGTKMVERAPGKGETAVWRCANVPSCQHTISKQAGPLPH